ncbi:hypothetical protein SARC_05604 [Sphaeroforma arctica JP610]|uniref:Uncharacterized protein n=1 Tax=Sphaeroforma arctica JP610 TaxID=667725 RepID=A0A0L0FZS0_9EUKA|nr:hypothetical protein SARC_05604 [Sphaeroforma arctica JP610]KNC82094.1 hypothetical protein SARC_05604 [Sphaeroforma arctica JP610]|eukprot:XP_014155996.1 hypothetical protein SARC_05604 [Sphaeroforma arctica JP610]
MSGSATVLCQSPHKSIPSQSGVAFNGFGTVYPGRAIPDYFDHRQYLLQSVRVYAHMSARGQNGRRYDVISTLTFRYL